MMMALPAKLRQQLSRLLAIVDDHKTPGPRLLEDAERLWQRTQRFIEMDLLGPEADLEALELACYAMQLPVRQGKSLPTGKLGKTSLRDRAEQAAELLVSLIGEEVDESLLDRTTRLLQEMPHRSPVLDESKLLADAVNLEDFGLIGLVQQAVQLSRQGGGVAQVIEAFEKREQYGYWQARLKDGFHFEPIRQMARRRLESARETLKLLQLEIKDDQPG
jgi:hypothetical protein